MPATADTTMIALSLATARALCRNAKAGGRAAAPILQVLKESEEDFDSALAALKRVEDSLPSANGLYTGEIRPGERFVIAGGSIVQIMKAGPEVHVRFPDGCIYGFPGDTFRALISAAIPNG